MAAASQLKVCFGDGEVTHVDKVRDNTSIQQYIQYKCAAPGREVSIASWSCTVTN
jgi:hypothetical protein